MARRRIKREKIVGVYADQIRWPHDQCRRHRFAAPAAVVQLRRQAVGIGDSHRRHTARSRPGAVGVAVSPSGAAARGSLKRAVAIVGATRLPCRPSGSHSRRRAVGEQLRYRAAASAARSCPLAVARFALMPVNLLSCRNFQGGSIPARRSGALLDRRTRDADVVDHQRPVGATLLSRAAPYWPCCPI